MNSVARAPRRTGSKKPEQPDAIKRAVLAEVVRAEAQMATTEAALADVEARIGAVGASISLLRAAAFEAGIRVSEAPTKVAPGAGAEERVGAKLASAFGDLIRGVIREEVAKVKPVKVEPPPPPSMPVATDYIRVGEAARMLSCSTRTVRHYITRGHLRGFRVGEPGSQRLLLSKGDVIDFVERGQTHEKVPELAPQVDLILAKLNSDAA